VSRGSDALRKLEAELEAVPAETPLTWEKLREIVREAAEVTESWEHDDYMGEGR